MAAFYSYLNYSILLVCLCAFTEVTAVEMTYDLRHRFAEKFNNKRETPDPLAKTMKFLEWSTELESSAQQRAEECNTASAGPDDKGELKGEITDPDADLTSVVDFWYAQHVHYDISSNQCQNQCDDYKQMLYAACTKVGCGVADCQGAFHVYCHFDKKLPDNTLPYVSSTNMFVCLTTSQLGTQRFCVNDPPCDGVSCTGDEEMDQYCICHIPQPETTTVAEQGQTTVVTEAECGTKKCENGEILNENCECYCPDGDTCGTEDKNRNGAATTGLKVPLLAVVVCLLTLFS